jgi:hypothetical protein
LGRRQRLAYLRFATEAIPNVVVEFGRSAIEGHHKRQDSSSQNWKQIGVNENTDSRKLLFFIQ